MAPTVGKLSSDGVYTPPPEVDDLQAVIVTATSKADSGLTGQALMLLAPGDPAHVNITPASLPSPLEPGSTQQFTAQVIGSRAKDQTLGWSVIPEDGGTVTASGLYRAPDTVTAQRVVAVMAALDVDPDQFNVVPILLVPPSG
jgi:hypothetical protein